MCCRLCLQPPRERMIHDLEEERVKLNIDYTATFLYEHNNSPLFCEDFVTFE